jgi:Restriction Enzyme Adenine Methylase Associated
MPIEDRNLEPGTRLVAHYKKQDRTCEVVTTDGGLRYRLDDGTEHKSPSSAGKAVIDHACNGWVFWSVEGTEKPKREPKAAAPDKPKKTAGKAAPKAKDKKPAKGAGKKKPKSAKAASKSNGSYGCGACGETFPTVKAATKHALTHTSAD